MKNLFIIDTYPSTKIQQDLLIECIDKLKNVGFDIMIVSHKSIPEESQKKVNYVIFDSDNTFLPSYKTPFFWLDILDSTFRVFNSGHALAITRNMQNALLMAKSEGYEFFYFLEYDVIIEKSDMDKLLNLRNNMISQGKKMIFFEPEDFYDCNSHVYETLFFGGDVNYLLSKFLPPKNIDEWDKLQMGYTLELAFYEKLSKYSEDFLIIPTHSDQFLSNSDVNLYRYGLMVCEMLYNHSNPHRPIFLIHQVNINPQNYIIKIYQDGVMILENLIFGGFWWFREFDLDGSEIKVDIYLHNEIQDTKYYIMDNNILDRIILKGDVISKP
jgi:hypothetical protein